jgi:pimeloyl-ACP methyl ester carboxylesterase
VPIKVGVNSQVISSLDDDFFDPGYGVMGLYNPSKFLEHTQGYLFGLEPLDEDKTQLLFVHGVTGTPRDWKSFVEGIDRSRFQPWFFFYPAGLPLDRTAAILAQLIQHLATGPTFKLQRLVVVAHSMGGLVARAALQRLSAPHAPSYLKMYVSLATPYGGHDAAGAAEKHAPELVPSWRDLAPGSPFLRALAATPLPADLPFFLLFSYNPARMQSVPATARHPAQRARPPNTIAGHAPLWVRCLTHRDHRERRGARPLQPAHRTGSATAGRARGPARHCEARIDAASWRSVRRLFSVSLLRLKGREVYSLVFSTRMLALCYDDRGPSETAGEHGSSC